jgi:hypothetical protein
MAEPGAARRPGSPVGGFGCPNLARGTGTRSPAGGMPARREGRRFEVFGGVRVAAIEPQNVWAIVEARRVAPVWTCWIGPPIDAVAPLERDVASAREVIPVHSEAARWCRDSARLMGINSSFVDILARHLMQRVFEGNGGRASLRSLPGNAGRA